MTKKKSKIIIDPQQYSGIYNHTKSELLQITIDKLKLKLKEYESGVKYRNIILASLGQILALLLVFATSDFKDWLDFSGEMWKAFFVLILVGLGVLLIYSIIMWFRKKITIDSMIEDFRKGK